MKYFVLFLTVLPLFSYSQKLHADLFAGIATYQGDLQGRRFTIDQSHPAIGVGASYDISKKFIVRTGLTYGVIEGNDKKILQQKVLNSATSVLNLL